ncbi:DUF1253-domain-containing protein [Rhizoclosmatium globosum]|uniref:U3 small nucleolar RNA-associated protein 25 n=1 Tax=Rhizoclosmatium globosum TaxID=329046 RepID=A0A1Y2BQU5_9FUNG|nr:DUF1253-domain-containing protein [Rhizoclosmatium globosum]|eukprot:ORY37110.1 DUF1253-domain-containing protein [Rhizoclosmatium globosum]
MIRNPNKLAKKGGKAAKPKAKDVSIVHVERRTGSTNKDSNGSKVSSNHFGTHFSNDRDLPSFEPPKPVEKKEEKQLGSLVFLECSALKKQPEHPLSPPSSSSNVQSVLAKLAFKDRLAPLAESLVESLYPSASSTPAPTDKQSRKRKEPSSDSAQTQLPPITNALLPLLSSYKDIQSASDNLTSKDAEQQVRLAYSIHAVNHVFCTRDRILKNTNKLNSIAAQEAEKERLQKELLAKEKGKPMKHGKSEKDEKLSANGKKAKVAAIEDHVNDDGDDDDDDDDDDVVDDKEEEDWEDNDEEDDKEDDDKVDEQNDDDSEDDEGNPNKSGDTIEYRDQGFTRPKVLILLPLKNLAFDVINHILALSGASQIENKSRFTTEFTLPPEEDGLDPSKPLDFQHDFRGNIDDCFRIGIKFSRRHLKLFADFYSADIIVASPLGLRMVVGAEGDKVRDFDFLSSIEMVIVDRCDMLMMQNWDHVQHIFNHLNVTPKAAHDCDFARIKSWYLDGRANLVRQNILLSHFSAPEINALMNKSCKNVDGRIKISSTYTGSIGEVVVQVPQMFTKFQCPSLTHHDDSRFTHFTTKFLPNLLRPGQDLSPTLLIVPSYLDFVRIRNHLHTTRIPFGELCEYTPQPDVSRNRSNFFHKKISLLVVTERFHFYRRYKIRGVKQVLWYQLPEYAHFYPEVVNAVEKGMDSNVKVLYSVYDRLRLERIVGTARVAKMMEKDTFMFA